MKKSETERTGEQFFESSGIQIKQKSDEIMMKLTYPKQTDPGLFQEVKKENIRLREELAETSKKSS